MGTSSVSGPSSGSTLPDPTSLSGTSGIESQDLSAEIAGILRGVDELATSLETSTLATQTSGPVLKAPNLSLNNVISTLNTTRTNLSLAIQESDMGDIDVLKSMFEQFLKFGNPGDLIAAIEAGTASTQSDAEIKEFLEKLKAGTATLDQNNLKILGDTFTQWLGTLSTKERSNAARNLLLLLYLLPESNTPSTDQSFASSSASGGRSLSLTAGTQTMTGASYFRELIRSLYDQVMQSLILTEGMQPTSIFSTRATKDASDIEQAFVFLIRNTALLSQKSALALLDGASNTTLQDPEVLNVVKATSVLSTLTQLLRPASVDNAVEQFASVLGIDLKSLPLANQAPVETGLAHFLQEGLVTSGLSALSEGLRGLFSKNRSAEEAQNQVNAINQRVTTLGKVLNGGTLTKDTLADTLVTFKKTVNDSSIKQTSLNSALTQVLQQSLQDQGVSSDTASGLASHLAGQTIGLFSQNTPVTALDIQTTLTDGLKGQSVDSSKVTNEVLTLAASVVTQQEVQTGLIQAKSATVASQIAPQLSQTLYGVSVDLGGKVTKGDPSTPPVIALNPSGALSKSEDVNIDLGASLLHDMEPATIAINRGSSVWHADTTRSTSGDRNIGPAPNSGP